MSQNFKQGLHISQTQSLKMTPQLQQAIKLLQMSRIELENAIQKEMIENPILEEIQESQEDSALKNEGDRREVKESDIAQKENDPRKQEQHEDSYIENYENYIDNTYQNHREFKRNTNRDEIMNYENLISVKTTLLDHLLWQAKTSGFSQEEVSIISVLIDYVNDNGYIEKSLDVISEETNIKLNDLEKNLDHLQEFDPSGVGARNLKECLLIQARHLQEDTHDVIELISHHLKYLEQKNYMAIARVMKRKLEDVKEICKVLEDMDPKPGRAFAALEAQHVTPDIYVYKIGNEYAISLNDDGIPRLKISNHYQNILGRNNDNGTQDYLKEKLRSAKFLIQSIYRRQKTLYLVTESIVKHQREFFEKGVNHIKPMNLKDISNDIEMHESTVSRVTTNKYVHTPQGIFELKYFFSSSIQTMGESLSSRSVRMKVKEMIEKEDPRRPLSDEKMASLLKKEGIHIARRTVAKYREAWGLLSSSKRKKFSY